MRVFASAPGKLVWLGEYAVLEGGPAVVMAVNRRARARLVDAGRSPPERPDGADGDGGAWHVEPEVVATVARALDCDPGAATGGLRAEVDSSALFAAGGEGRVKLGLGSSAALTVAMAGAVCALQGRVLPGIAALIAAHGHGQRARGSGVDVSAAVHGGVSVYRMDGPASRRQPVELPPRLQWCCVWSGRPASTGELLARMAAWRARAPERHAAAMDALAAVAESGVAAIERGDAEALVGAASAYGRQLASLSEASGIDIACREHRAIGDTARACGVAYKSCGAGGGDVGVAMTTDSRALAEFRRRAACAGWRLLDLATDTRGLEARASA